MSKSATARVNGSLSRIFARPEAGLIIFIIAFCIVLSILAPSFLAPSNLFYLFNQTVFLAILGIGLTIVLISRGLDLSVGSVLALGGGVAGNLISNGFPMVVAFTLALVAGACLGLINGLVITKLKVPPFIATLAMLSIAGGTLYVWTQAIPFSGYMNDFYYALGGLTPLNLFGVSVLTLPILITFAVALLAAAVLKWTQFGRHVYAVGSNAEAARLSGVNVDRVKIYVYMISGLLAALAGILLAGRLAIVQPDMGVDMELEAIAVAIMGGAALSGGRGTVIGALAGAFTFTLVQNAISILNLNPNWETAVVGFIILLAIVANNVFARSQKVSSAL